MISAEPLVPLRGLPSKIKVDGEMLTFGPSSKIRKAAETYCQLAGIKPRFPLVYNKLNKDRAKRIAEAYEDMIPTPEDPETIDAFNALCKETLAQWEVIKATGLKVEFITDGEQPYQNPRKAILDIICNNHMFVTPTLSGYGTGDVRIKVNDPKNPLLALTTENISGKPTLVNDIFRIVHDYFGHSKEGLGFRAEGEENAWRCHAAMFSPLARRAATVELRGQNSWVNYGPHGDHNRKAGAHDTIFADQKIGLLPEWASEEGREDDCQEVSFRP